MRVPPALSASLNRLWGSRTPYLLIGLTALGVLLRLATFSTWGIVYDGAEYAVMGQSLLQHGEFLVPVGSGAVYSHHYGPLFPLYLSLFYSILGFSVPVTKAAELVLAVLFITVAYATTKDLCGRTKAWYVAAFVALEPMFFITTAIGYADDLVGLLFVATVWAVVKSLRKPPYVLLAGALAGLGFLAKAPIGYVFLLAGVAGLAWRVRYRGWGVLRDRWYVSGIAVFGILAGGWSLR
ncbi:MAG TPA: glycosyltransferase family 39 protein, partial [Thermoplasmata archaeon]